MIATSFAGGLGAAGVLARLLDRDPCEHTALDLAVLGAATFKAARTIARDEVTSFLRDPFVAGKAHEGGENPVETGDMRQAIGELVTCSRCIGTWVAAGLGSVQILATLRRPAHLDPRRRRDQRLPPSVLRGPAAKSNELERRAG